MKTNSATCETDFRAIAVGGCFGLLALLLSFAAATLAAQQDAHQYATRSRSARAELGGTPPAIQATDQSSLARLERSEGAR